MSASTITTDSTTTTTSSFRVLGVAGGIGSGKSTACKLLVDSCGCLAHIDADKVAHSVYAPGSQAVHDVVSEFGKGVLACDENNNAAIQPLEIDRKKLGPIVFADRSAMARLERIVWPHVKDKLAQKIGELKVSWNNSNSNPDATDATTTTKPRPIVVLEAAILLDAGWDDLLDGVWVVTVPRERALTRLVETRGLTEAEAAKRIDAQNRSRGIGTLADEVSNGVVQCVIENSKSLDDLAKTLTASLEDPSCWK
jgi:dephospho-CoA kinase